jgi:hypothetical protein
VAACVCGALRLTASGEPRLVSSCCCQACQRRTGSFFGVTCFFAVAQISGISGSEALYRRRGESGRELTFRFCPSCGTTLYWTRDTQPELISVAGGAFADPSLPGPTRMVWTQHRHRWVCTPEGLPTFPKSPP